MEESDTQAHAGRAALRSTGAKALSAYLHHALSAGQLRAGARLPPERELSQRFHTSRGTVRRVLAEFRARGLITQTAGSGTFVLALADALAVPEQPGWLDMPVSPAELMQARRLIEPLMPILIARHATAADFAVMQSCLERSEAAQTIEDFEHWDGELHKAFAVATHNALFVQNLELTNRAREQGEWGRLKRNSLTPQRRQEYERQHRTIVAALRDRDAARAGALLSQHLEQVQHNLFGE
ncbi:MAG TPA: FCD domain-containing protein [Bordetella sp.]|uniref:FadR/GntR family transcriptional regulator n=1 Tax=Bordetella sp. TaxID=28081 RepID=UPI002C6883D2|nr:FCD domain-containing protein [Stenotrophobium sp.]